MKKLVFTFCSFLMLTLVSFAQEAGSNQIESAKTAYEAEDYQVANDIYQKLLEDDYQAEGLHYNYANSLFKSNNTALAILHYEKALKLNPASEDAAYNLKIANEKTVDKIEAIPELFFYRWWKSIYNLFPADSWANIMIAFLLVALLGFALYKFMTTLSLRKLGFSVFATALVLALITWGLAASQRSYANQTTHAIIMNSTVDILSAPSSGSSQLFVLHEGTKVKIENRSADWLEVALPNGNQGWVKQDVLAEI